MLRVKVTGALDARCEGQHVYQDRSGNYTLAEDDRVSSADFVLEHLIGDGMCELVPISEEQLARWWRRRSSS